MTDASQQPWPGEAWPAATPRPRRPARAALVAVAIFAAVAVLGAPLGLLWAALAPAVPVRMGDDGALLVETQPEEFIAADGWFSLLGLGFGVLAAIGVWLLVRRWRGPLALLALAAGAVGAGLLAWWLGRQMGAGEYQRLLDSATVGTVFGKPADLRAADVDLALGFLPVVNGDVLVPALGAAVAYTLLAGWSRFASLRPDTQAADHAVPGLSGPGLSGPGLGTPGPDHSPVNSGSGEKPVPPAAPAPPEPGSTAPSRG